MYSIKVIASFSSAHNLRGHKGKCEELHGHNWKVEVRSLNERLDKIGMVMDFQYLKKKLNNVLEKLDHKYLNKIPYFKKYNPTSENMAKYIYDRLKAQRVEVESVTVWESDNSCAAYEE
ncbi:MAG: 6-carboxytetrahydropterin synthase QueD [Candidatus Omnitrophica bacterium]|nr:6-carboxytetrahydropterin synthase QueD [Candidatus Omnitrophota bacterium]MBU1906209.1 6-carboxytetrahydropterin synthase QueD [Candidatus Omnitrophota bacterium]